MRFRIISTVLLASAMFSAELQAGKLNGKDCVFFQTKSPNVRSLHEVLTTSKARTGSGTNVKILETGPEFVTFAEKTLGAGNTDAGAAVRALEPVLPGIDMLGQINKLVGPTDEDIAGYGIANEYSVGGVLSNASKQLNKDSKVATPTAVTTVKELISADTTKSLYEILTTALNKINQPTATTDPYNGMEAVNTAILVFSASNSASIEIAINKLNDGSRNSFGTIEANAGDIKTLETNAKAVGLTGGLVVDNVALETSANNYLTLITQLSAQKQGTTDNAGFQVKNKSDAYITVDVSAVKSIFAFVNALIKSYKS